MGVRTEKKDRAQGMRMQNAYALGEAFKLARPDFHFVVIVDDVVVRFETAVVEIAIVVNAGVVGISEA